MRVLVADDHPMLRDSLGRMIRLLERDVQLSEADTFDAIEILCASQTFDLAVVDLNMPGMEGLSGLRRLRGAYPAMPLVVTSGQEDLQTIRAVMGIGVRGFLPKSDPHDETQKALRLVLDGATALPPRARGLVATGLSRSELDRPQLTERQLDVLYQLMEDGTSNREIGCRLGMGEGTVRTHIAAVLLAFAVRNRTEAVIRARELGFRRSER